MGLLGISILERARSVMDSMRSKFQLTVNKQGSELKKVRNDLSLAIKRAEEAEAQLAVSRDTNEKLQIRVNEITRSWESFRAVASDANKINKLIEGFVRIKRELLETRRICDLGGNENTELKRENARLKLLVADASTDGKLDVAELLDLVAGLKKENSQLKMKTDQQDRLLKSLKDREEKLVAALRRNNI
jgi:hypothetical protein